MSFTSVTFSNPRVLYIKCTTCFSRYATQIYVISDTFFRTHRENACESGTARFRREPPQYIGRIAVYEHPPLHKAGLSILLDGDPRTSTTDFHGLDR